MKKIELPSTPESLALLTSSAKAQEDDRQRDLRAREFHLRVMDHLWARMTGTYGNKFTNQFGTEPNPDWIRELEAITPDQMKQGLDSMLLRDNSFCPDLAEFKALCLPATISPTGFNSGAYIEFESSNKIESDEVKIKRKDAGQSALNNMKDLF